MEQAPLQNTMPAHHDAALAVVSPLRHTVLGVLALAIFGVASLGVFDYLVRAETADTVSQVAAAAAATEEAHAAGYFATTTLVAKSAFVADIDTGAILYSQDPDAQLPLASLTKVALVLAVSSVLPQESILTLPSGIGASSQAGAIPPGSHVQTSDLIAYTLIASSNEGAETLAAEADEPLRARYVAASAGDAAVWRMNDVVRELGLTHTYYLNPSGLDESTTQSGAYGSARDMARLFAYAASSSPGLFAATREIAITIATHEGTPIQASNTDDAIDSFPGLIMGKTGYTDLAGGNLAIVFRAPDGHRIVAVVLGSTRQGRFDDMRALVRATTDALTTSSTL